MSEGFVNPLKRDYVGGTACATAAAVLPQLEPWREDCN